MFLFHFRFDIEVVGISSDGDSRLYRCMKIKTKIGQKHSDTMPTYFNASLTNTLYVQDTIHTVLKLRNKLLQASLLLPLGNKQVSISHLKILIEHFSKNEHGLVRKDICPDNRQNFASLEKITKPQVLQSLQQYIPDSEATVLFLKLCHYVTSSFMDATLTPLERISRIWFSIFFLRIWRYWITDIVKRHEYTLQDNFITQNAYTSIEINGHSLVQLIMKLRSQDKPEQFIPIMCSSQACESTFRQFRSMTSAYWTKINMSLLEIFNIVGRIELQNDITHFKISEVNFPRTQNKVPKMTVHELPSNEEIFAKIEAARNEAVKVEKTFGIKISPNNNLSCKLPVCEMNLNNNTSFERSVLDTTAANDVLCEQVEQLLLRDESPSEEEQFNINSLAYINSELNLRDYSDQNIVLNNLCPFTEVKDKCGNTKVVRKSSVLWLLTTSRSSLSSDRLQRVQTKAIERVNQRSFSATSTKHNELSTFTSGTLGQQAKLIWQNDELHIGDWCIFADEIKNKPPRPNADIYSGVFAGLVIGFKYIVGKTVKAKQYSWNNAPVHTNLDRSLRRGINVLATWYKYTENGNLISLNATKKHFFRNINNYVGTVKSFERSSGNLKISLHSDQLIHFNQQLSDLLKKR